jgi:hypothetical protein
MQKNAMETTRQKKKLWRTVSFPGTNAMYKKRPAGLTMRRWCRSWADKMQKKRNLNDAKI